MKKIIFALVIVSCIFISGCGDPAPVPEEAVKTCLDKGWIPYYHATAGAITFKCTKCDTCE